MKISKNFKGNVKKTMKPKVNTDEHREKISLLEYERFII